MNHINPFWSWKSFVFLLQSQFPSHRNGRMRSLSVHSYVLLQLFESIGKPLIWPAISVLLFFSTWNSHIVCDLEPFCSDGEWLHLVVMAMALVVNEIIWWTKI